MNVLDKISKIRTWFMVYEPFFGQLLLLTTKENNKTCPTMGVTSRGELIYNSEFVSGLTDNKLLFVIAHEILHLAYMHPFRCGTRDPMVWNIAADLKVNYDLIIRSKKIGEPVEGGLIPNPFNSGSFTIPGQKEITNIADKTTEQIYDELMTMAKGKTIKVEFNKDLITDGSLSGAEASAIENSIRAKVFEAMQRSKGNTPAGLKSEFSAMMAPKIKWSFIIQHKLKTMLKEKTWKVPNKRYLPYYFPGHTKHKTAKIIFSIDTSGSMSDDEINEALSEILGYANTFKAHEFYIIPCDCEEQEPIKIRGTDKNKLRKGLGLEGGGGTDYEPVFNTIKKTWNNSIDFLVYFTDLECNFPDRPPYQIYWVSRSKNKEVPYGRIINL